jgi:hypothetical protein
MMFSLEKMLEITGEPEFADRLEQVAYNVLPTQITDDHYARQYFQQANQVQCTFADRDFFNDGGSRVVYGLLTGYPCCTCNLHQGWPKFVQHLWMASADGGLAALAYGPSRVTAKVADDTEVSIIEETSYPFEETIRFTIETPRRVEFPLHLRIPAWCENAQVLVDGTPWRDVDSGSIVVLNRTWGKRSEVELRLPMTIRKSEWEDRSVALERGPLLYALRIEEDWSEVHRPSPDGVPGNAMHRGYRECQPTSPWNYALLADAVNEPESGFEVIKRTLTKGNPWNLSNAPLELRTTGVRLPQWTLYANSAGRVPLSPVAMPDGAEPETIRLIPYGCTTLRISAFPTVRGGSFTVFRRQGVTSTASHVFEGDTLAAVNDGLVPKDGNPRHTFWPRRGTQEWIQYDLAEPRELSTTKVFWYDDTGHGQCRTPESWRVLYRAGGEWKMVATTHQPGTKRGEFNTLHFDPVLTDALRLEIQLRDDFSAGVIEWQVE